MKEIERSQIVSKVASAVIDANLNIDKNVKDFIYSNDEDNPRAVVVLEQIKENLDISRKTKLPLCQDTGMVVAFIEIGNEVTLNFDLYDAINEGVRVGYKDGLLRKSVVSDPLLRKNTGDNTPCVFHTSLTMGDKLQIELAPKGAGSENMSMIKMFNPTTPVEEIKKYVIDTIFNANAKPCPPIIVGVGIGGTFEKAALLAKEAAITNPSHINQVEFYENLENELLLEINNLGIGPMGVGGKTTALGVNIKTYPCHIASLPVAINIQCHVARHIKIEF